MFIDHTGLLRAIQTLDDGENSPAKVREALAFLLEFVWFLDMRSNPADRGSQTFIIVCEARLLGCLKRFVSQRKHDEEMWLANSSNCTRGCHRKLVRLAIVVILFGICCHSSLAPILIKERLHLFFTEMCLPQDSKAVGEHVANANGAKSFCEANEEMIDPQDLLFTVDPFDWCYQSVCARVIEDHRDSFLVPLGARSLAHLLRGEPIPTDEITERLNHHSSSCSYDKPYSGRKVKSELPSIFAFAREKSDDSALGNAKGCGCTHPSPAMLVASNEITLQHWALRSLITLALHLHRPSSLRKDLIADGNIVTAFVAYLYLDSKTGDTKWLSDLSIHQTIALRRTVLCNMAIAGISIIQDEEITSIRTRHPNVYALIRKAREIHSSRNNEQVMKLKAKEKKGKSILTLKDRLSAARAESKQELSKNCHMKQDLERSRYRQSLRAISERMESLRRHFDRGFDVLYSGRIHPIPDQSFADWISSFQTIETLEQEQQHQEQMRQRHVLEMQYRQREMRRRECDERTEMQMNDINVHDIKEQNHQKQQRHQFLDLQNEMKQIAAHNEIGWSARTPNQIHQASNTVKQQEESSDHKRKILEDQVREQEMQRLHWLTIRKREGKELERMSKEDLYYAEQLQKVKELQHAQAKELARVNPIEQHQRQIERRRILDIEMKLMAKERQAMYTEDLFGRQYQLADVQRRKWDVQNEWRARKSMFAEEKDSRVCWKLLEKEKIDQEQKELKRQRGLERQQRRQQKQYKLQVSCSWIESWDEYGNRYYYNQLTGCSQWENPFN